MDKTRAKHFAKKVEGQLCSGWEIQDYLNCGKSAIVLKAKKGEQHAAIKIFDPELVERHGVEIQEERIKREKSLIGQSHPNLVQILDGGVWPEQKLFFVVMEYLPWKNLADVLSEIPTGHERSIIAQVASAARFLEGLKLCHRDIKPENVAVSSDFQKVKLLDLGVVKPCGSKSITDGSHGKFFVGTLRYSPPEFLLGQEKDAVEDWRAISFYQIGGVLHDLIMRRPLFAEYENPFARLVNAVQDIKPEIESKSVSPALVELARHCLLKIPRLRLELVSWEAFEQEPVSQDKIAELKSRISKRLVAKRDAGAHSQDGEEMLIGTSQLMEEYARNITSICRLECVENCSIFPPIEIQPVSDGARAQYVTIQFEPSVVHGLNYHIFIKIQVEWIDAKSDVVKVGITAAVSSVSFKSVNPVFENCTDVYRGSFASDPVRRYILPILYKIIDQAQQFKKPIKGDVTIHELKIGENQNE